MGSLAAFHKLHARPMEAVEHWRARSIGGGNVFVKTPYPSTQQRIELLVPGRRACRWRRFVARHLAYGFSVRRRGEHGVGSLPAKSNLRGLRPRYARIDSL